MDELSRRRHEDYVKVGRVKSAPWVLLTIVCESVALLKDRNGESMSVEVDSSMQREGEESLWHRALILNSKAMIKL